MSSSADETAGFVLAISSLIMTAIFPIFSKISRVRSTGINPMVFNIYFECGVILFCILITIIVSIAGSSSIHFTYMGLISGVILGIGSWFVWLALTYMGISHTAAIASGVASFIGFLEGLAIENAPNLSLSILALFLIVIGILGVGFNEILTSFIMQYIFCKHDERAHLPFLTPEWLDSLEEWESYEPHRLLRLSSHGTKSINSHQHMSSDDEDETEITPLNKHNEAELESDDEENNVIDGGGITHIPMKPYKMRTTGIIFAILGGMCFGSLSFPEEFTSNKTTEAYFLPSFGVGVVLMLIVDFAVLSLKLHGELSWHFKQCFVPGLASGIIWAVGFLCILYAELLIDYSLAIPIRECSICLAVLIGIFGFKEVTDTRAIIVTLICVCIAVVGCFLVAMDVE